MSNIPDDLHYTKTHEWVRLEDDGSVTLGITDHAQEQLGDLVYVELPDVGRTVTGGEELAVVESVKAASDIYGPLTGEVCAVNEALADAPDLVNTDPYGEGWLLRLMPADSSDLDELMEADDYSELAASEAS